MLFPDVIAAKAAGESVGLTHLVLFDFEDAPFRAWEAGAGILRAAGEEWTGLGVMGRIGALPTGSNDSAGAASFMLSGVDPVIVAKARSEVDTIIGREVTVWAQFLSGPLRPLDDPIFLGTWVMEAPRFTFSGPQSRTITVPARSIFDDRNSPAFTHYADVDQKARFAGDRFLETMSEMTAGKIVAWPDL